jgi:hypothetical protein
MLALALDSAIENAGDLNLLVRSGRKDLCKRTAHRTKAKQTYPQIFTPLFKNQYSEINAQKSLEVCTLRNLSVRLAGSGNKITVKGNLGGN